MYKTLSLLFTSSPAELLSIKLANSDYNNDDFSTQQSGFIIINIELINGLD